MSTRRRCAVDRASHPTPPSVSLLRTEECAAANIASARATPKSLRAAGAHSVAARAAEAATRPESRHGPGRRSARRSAASALASLRAARPAGRARGARHRRLPVGDLPPGLRHHAGLLALHLDDVLAPDRRRPQRRRGAAAVGRGERRQPLARRDLDGRDRRHRRGARLRRGQRDRQPADRAASAGAVQCRPAPDAVAARDGARSGDHDHLLLPLARDDRGAAPGGRARRAPGRRAAAEAARVAARAAHAVQHARQPARADRRRSDCARRRCSIA